MITQNTVDISDKETSSCDPNGTQGDFVIHSLQAVFQQIIYRSFIPYYYKCGQKKQSYADVRPSMDNVFTWNDKQYLIDVLCCTFCKKSIKQLPI